MRTLRPAPSVAFLALLAPLVLLSARAVADPPAPPTPSASAEATSASASVSASATPKKLRTLEEHLARDPGTTTPTPAPPSSAWATAAKLFVEPGNVCEVQRIREWLRVHCVRGDVEDVSLLSGDPTGVALAVTGAAATDADIVLPLRKGRSFVVAVTSLTLGKYSSGLPEQAALLWVLWPDADAAPTVRVELRREARTRERQGRKRDRAAAERLAWRRGGRLRLSALRGRARAGVSPPSSPICG
jgi:hypothetical protein